MADERRTERSYDCLFKLLIIGNTPVGKSSFVSRYVDDTFTSSFISTVGIDFKEKTVFPGDKRVFLQARLMIVSTLIFRYFALLLPG